MENPQYYGILKINVNLREEIVKITRGVKQAGVLSPQLFNFFINDFIKQIQSMGIGCKIKEDNVPIMGFCDDTLLLATLLSHLKQLVECCENYSKKWLLKYNQKISFFKHWKSGSQGCGY